MADQADLPKLPTAVNHFSDQVSGLAAVVHACWTWVLQSLDTHSPSDAVSNWVLTRLLPVAYWQQQLAKTKTSTLHQAYHSAYAQAHRAFAHDESDPQSQF